MNRGVAPVIGVLALVIITLLLASMFVVSLPSLFDWQMMEDSINSVVDHGEFSHPTGPNGSNGPVPVIVYTDTQGHLHSLSSNGTRIHYRPPAADNGWNVEAIGPKRSDLDGDDLKEIPYVNGSNYLKVIDVNNETQVLAREARKNLVGVGTWGTEDVPSETAVYYVNNSNGALYRARPGSPPESIADGSFRAVAGIADLDNDGSTELVYVNNQEELGYLGGGEDDETTTTSTGYGAIGKSDGYGIGQPADLNGDGKLRAPIINNQPEAVVVTANGSTRTLGGSGSPAKAPVTIVDWSDDTEKAIVYVGKNEKLYYVTYSGSTYQLVDADGDTITADADQGVA